MPSFKKMFYGKMLIQKLGFEDASIVLYGLVSSKFNTSNTSVLLSQMKQFVREEFDAATQGNDYARNFVRVVCPDSNWYEGAMTEESEYPIDGDDGPQQTLLNLTFEMMAMGDDELAVKLRCKIVDMIYSDYKVLEASELGLPVSEFSGLDFKTRRERLAYLFMKVGEMI